MKTITIKVPEGIYKLAQSIAFQQDTSVEDFAAEGLAQIIHESMKQKLPIRSESTMPCLN